MNWPECGSSLIFDNLKFVHHFKPQQSFLPGDQVAAVVFSRTFGRLLPADRRAGIRIKEEAVQRRQDAQNRDEQKRNVELLRGRSSRRNCRP